MPKTTIIQRTLRLTFTNKVRVYKNDNTKAESPIESGTVFTPTGGNNITKTMTFYLEGFAASAAFCDVPLKAIYSPVSNSELNIPMLNYTDSVNVTVFGVQQTGIFSGAQQPDNPERHKKYYLSYDENGLISWDLPLYVGLKAITGIDYCKYFANCMEMQSTVSPPRDANPSKYYGNSIDYSDPNPPPGIMLGDIGFTQNREKYKQSWKWKNETGEWELMFASPHGWTWKPDVGGLLEGMANRVTNSSHLYYIDGPGLEVNTTDFFNYYQYYANFRNNVSVSFYNGTFICSDYAKWYSKVFLKTIPGTNYLTRAKPEYQALGSGWIDIPTTPATDKENW